MQGREQQLISEIQQIREQYLAEVGTSKRRSWPKSIRERATELDQLGMKPKLVAKLTAVPYETLVQWRYQRRQKSPFHEIAVQQNQVPLAVTVASNGATPINATVTVTLISGHKIEGTVAAVAGFLKQGITHVL